MCWAEIYLVILTGHLSGKEGQGEQQNTNKVVKLIENFGSVTKIYLTMNWLNMQKLLIEFGTSKKLQC